MFAQLKKLTRTTWQFLVKVHVKDNSVHKWHAFLCRHAIQTLPQSSLGIGGLRWPATYIQRTLCYAHMQHYLTNDNYLDNNTPPPLSVDQIIEIPII